MRYMSRDHNDVSFHELTCFPTSDLLGAHLAKRDGPGLHQLPAGDESRRTLENMEDVCVSLVHFNFAPGFTAAGLNLELVSGEQWTASGERRCHRLVVDVNDSAGRRLSSTANKYQSRDKQAEHLRRFHAARSVLPGTFHYNANFDRSRPFSLALGPAMWLIELMLTA